MATKRNFRKLDTKGPARLGKSRGIIQQRVQETGPERFAVVSIDCGNAPLIVSIHALVKRATADCPRNRYGNKFQSTPS